MAIMPAVTEEPAGCNADAKAAHTAAVEEYAEDDGERCEEREAECEAEFARCRAVPWGREAAVGVFDARGGDAFFSKRFWRKLGRGEGVLTLLPVARRPMRGPGCEGSGSRSQEFLSNRRIERTLQTKAYRYRWRY